MEKRAIIDRENTPINDKPCIKEASTKKLENHISKRLADKVKEKTTKSIKKNGCC